MGKNITDICYRKKNLCYTCSKKENESNTFESFVSAIPKNVIEIIITENVSTETTNFYL